MGHAFEELSGRILEAAVAVHKASYLKATGIRVGLLLNFDARTLVIKRVVL
jgi:hypothetical protein